MFHGFRYFWNATRGYRLKPWKSPYLLWRMETFSGAAAEDLTAEEILKTVWTEKIQFLRFLRWTQEIQTYRVQIGRKGH